MIYLCVFSPAGHSATAAEAVASVWGSWEMIDLSRRDTDFSKYTFTQEDLLLWAVPSYGGRVPAIAVERMKQLNGAGAKAVALVSYGRRAYDDTLLEMKEILTACGFVMIAAVAALAEHTIVPAIASGRPDATDRVELAAFGKKIMEKYQSGNDSAVDVPGNMPYRIYNGVPAKPEASGACTRCGACSAACPVGAIPAENPETTDPALCITCMRCVYRCPAKARSLNAEVLAAVGAKLAPLCAGDRVNELFI
ncbi:MAG: 4Fe-4S binding protein [Lentisphaeria bacterium]|nr:4Fe-4S binding protein [Lentisphaeria bacterium]